MAIDITSGKFLDINNMWYYYKDTTDDNVVYITEYNRTKYPTIQIITVPSIIKDSDGIEKTVYGIYKLFYKDNIITEVNFNDGIISIDNCTCYQCPNLISIRFPESLLTIGTYCFWSCNNIETIVMTNTITIIGEGCFCNCINLKRSNISNSIQKLSSLIFKNCPNLVMYVESNSYALEYCINNNIDYIIVDKESIIEDNEVNTQYFVAGVADVEIFKNDQLFVTAKTLIDSSLTIGVSAEDVRAGQGAKLYGKFFHTSTFDLKLQDAMFRLEYLAASVGTDLELGGDVFSEETYVAQDKFGTFNLLYTPVSFTSDGYVYIYWKKSYASYYNVKKIPVEKVSTKVQLGDTNIGESYCIKYLYTNDTAKKIEIKSSFNPDTLSVIMKANLYNGDANNLQSYLQVGTITIKVPRFLLSGSQEINMNMNGATNIPLEGSALASRGIGCNGEDIYAEIIEVINGRSYQDIVALKIQNDEDLLVLYVGEKFTLNVYGRFKDSYFVKINNSKLSFTTTAPDYVEIDENGIITAKKPTYGVLVPLIASLVDNLGNLLQYDIRKVIVRPK